MKKTFISPKAEVKVMATESLLANGSNMGIKTNETVSGTSDSHFQAGAKAGMNAAGTSVPKMNF